MQKRMLKFKDFVNYLNETLNNNINHTQEESLLEGGAYGHLTHPFEDIGLTFLDLEEMLMSTVNGAFGPENFVQEKTDGQQLSISWKNGKVIAARNGSHLKNAGENAMDIKGVADLFAGRGDIETVYNAAMKDLSASISALSPKDKEKYFAEGKKFASLEIITPVTQNTVPYGLNMLVFHGVLEYDEAGKVVDEDKQAGRDLGKLIADANASSQETFFVRGPQDIASKPLPNTKARASYYKSKLSSIMKDSGCSQTSTVGDYALGMAKNIITSEAKAAKVEIPSISLDGLARRVADIDKSYTVGQIKKDMPDGATWYSDLEKKMAKKWKRAVYGPLESMFLEIGTEMMKNISSFLSANPTAAAESMKKEIDATIAKIKTNGDEVDVEKMEHELTRVSAAGGLESIVPTEGITFVFKGKLYKYTGIFAPLHQIRSILAYKK
jgi:hypothetical protein